MTVDHIQIRGEPSNIEFAEDFELRDEVLARLERMLDATEVAVQEALAHFSPSADEFQQQVIDAKEATIRVVAPAGSGKTQTLINRVLVNVGQGTAANRILLLTFDNSAAASIREKIADQLNRLDITLKAEPIVSTLNAFGFSILRRHYPDEYNRVASRGFQVALVRQLRRDLEEIDEKRARSLPHAFKNTLYLDLFSLFKNNLYDPRALNNQDLVDFVLSGPQIKLFL